VQRPGTSLDRSSLEGPREHSVDGLCSENEPDQPTEVQAVEAQKQKEGDRTCTGR